MWTTQYTVRTLCQMLNAKANNGWTHWIVNYLHGYFALRISYYMDFGKSVTQKWLQCTQIIYLLVLFYILWGNSVWYPSVPPNVEWRRRDFKIFNYAYFNHVTFCHVTLGVWCLCGTCFVIWCPPMWTKVSCKVDWWRVVENYLC